MLLPGRAPPGPRYRGGAQRGAMQVEIDLTTFGSLCWNFSRIVQSTDLACDFLNQRTNLGFKEVHGSSVPGADAGSDHGAVDVVGGQSVLAGGEEEVSSGGG